jgi:ABC-type phosphate transport system substrate-binding protein
VQAQGSSTGYVALLAADTKTEIARFDRTSSAEAIASGINHALAAPAAKAKAKP